MVVDLQPYDCIPPHKSPSVMSDPHIDYRYNKFYYEHKRS